MANPQPDQFTKISNELFAAIMTTDFSKRQRNILDLVIRMSYGCGKKTADIKRSEFELVGVRKGHVKQELNYLVQSKVISVDKEQIQINKNYDQWRVSIVTCFDPDKFGQLIKRNLDSRPVTKTVTSKNEELPKQEPSSYQNSNTPVTETVTDTPSNPNGDNGYSDLKESIKKSKDIYKKEEDYNHFFSDVNPDFQKIESHYINRRGSGFMVSPTDSEAIKRVLETDISLTDVLASIDYSFDNYKPQHSRDKINSFKYCESVILDHDAKRKARKKVTPFPKKQEGTNNAKPSTNHTGSNSSTTQPKKGKWDHLVIYS